MKTRYATNIPLMSTSRHVAVVGLLVGRARLAPGRRDPPALGEASEEDRVAGEPDDRVVAEHVHAGDGGGVRKALVAQRLSAGLLGRLLDLGPGSGSQQRAGLCGVGARQLIEGLG